MMRAHERIHSRGRGCFRAPRQQRLRDVHPGVDRVVARAHGRPRAAAGEPGHETAAQRLRQHHLRRVPVRLRDASAARAPKRDYFIGERGWLDLLGSIPSFGVVGNGKYASLFRLARISRLARIARVLRGQSKKELVDDVLENRGQYAVFITMLAALVVLVLASVLVLQFEGKDPNANIQTGGDALWWAWVTITTVGYGDFYPITTGGRLVGFFVMLTGIGIIGALASIFASLLVSPSEPPPLGPDVSTTELQAIRAELAGLREQLAQDGSGEPR
jgi:Ion channel